MHKPHSFFFTVFFLVSHFCSAQIFERIYPGLGLNDIGSLDNTLDSGFIFCGNQNGGFLMKLNANGDTEWTRKDTGDMHSTSAVIQDASSNFIVVGSGPSAIWNSIAVVSTYDANGNFLSDIEIPPPDGWGSSGTTIVRSPDRQESHYCYYVDGSTADNSFLLDNQDMIAGDMTTVGLNSISMDNNGNYYGSGTLAFDLDTLFTWHNNVLILSSSHFPRREYFYDTQITSSAITSDGGVLLAGLYDTLGTKYLRLMKFDSAANLLWGSFIADTSFFSVNQVTQTDDGGFAILCAADNGANMHIAFLKTDAAGNQIWKHEFFGNGSASPKNFKILDNGFVILGSTGGDPYVIRTDNMGSANGATTISEINRTGSMFISPNPSTGAVHVSGTAIIPGQTFISIFDMTGREVYAILLRTSNQQVDLSFLAKGVYQFQLTGNETELKRGKFVIE